jgi:hypothetical protein
MRVIHNRNVQEHKITNEDKRSTKAKLRRTRKIPCKCYYLNKAFRASSPALLALVAEGLIKLFLTLPFPAPPVPAPTTAFTFALAALAAAMARRRFPLLGLLFEALFLSVTPGLPGDMAFSFSVRLRDGLGWFSSSEKSYSGR